ncbi:unnamed protein product [Oikopleura dioica]|uniref:Uncharacterized protein n=1 Tax=Oikopleura dioica TaxID=34765 RepID=E4Y5D9_OIKDI|nr:unnamed protein product [Oikopleura dioica]
MKKSTGQFQLYLGNILRFQRNCICSGLEPGLRGPPDRSRHQVRRQYCEGIRHKYRHHRLHCHVRRLLRLPDSDLVCRRRSAGYLCSLSLLVTRSESGDLANFLAAFTKNIKPY